MRPMSEQSTQPVNAPRSRTGLIIGIGAAALLCLTAAILVVLKVRSDINGLKSNPVNARVGNCITETFKADASDAKRVDCSSPDAQYKVVAVVEDVNQTRFKTNPDVICNDTYTDWYRAIWLGGDNFSGKGPLLGAPRGMGPLAAGPRARGCHHGGRRHRDCPKWSRDLGNPK
jgi:hypothetical protein